jgi:hypothetical protein
MIKWLLLMPLLLPLLLPLKLMTLSNIQVKLLRLTLFGKWAQVLLLHSQPHSLLTCNLLLLSSTEQLLLPLLMYLNMLLLMKIGYGKLLVKILNSVKTLLLKVLLLQNWLLLLQLVLSTLMVYFNSLFQKLLPLLTGPLGKWLSRSLSKCHQTKSFQALLLILGSLIQTLCKSMLLLPPQLTSLQSPNHLILWLLLLLLFHLVLIQMPLLNKKKVLVSSLMFIVELNI